MYTVNFLCDKVLEVSGGDNFSLTTYSFQSVSHNGSPFCILKAFSYDSETLCGVNLPGLKPVVKLLSSLKDDTDSFCVSCLTSSHDFKLITSTLLQYEGGKHVPGFRALINFGLKPAFSLTFTLQEKFKLYNNFHNFLNKDYVHAPGHEPSFETITFVSNLVKLLKKEVEFLREEIFKTFSLETLAFECALNDFYLKQQESLYSFEELQSLFEKFKLVSFYQIFFNDKDDVKLKEQVKKDCVSNKLNSSAESEILYLYYSVVSNIYYHPSYEKFKHFSLFVQGKHKGFKPGSFSLSKVKSWESSFDDKYSSLLSLYTVLSEDNVYALIPHALSTRIILSSSSSVSVASCVNLTNENLSRVTEVAVKLFNEGMTEFSLPECLNHALLLE